MQKVLDFLAAARVFFFATVDGGRPRIRPFGFFMEYSGKLYFGMGTHKAVWKQVTANPNVEICSLKPGPDREWIRISGKAVADDSPEALQAAFAKMPHLKEVYSEKSGLTMGLVWINDGKAEFNGKPGSTETVSF